LGFIMRAILTAYYPSGNALIRGQSFRKRCNLGKANPHGMSNAIVSAEILLR
ncbi:hypothetical protein J6590_097292, partial [Homalodisca vitripennis]